MHRLAEAVEDRIDGLFGGEIGGVEGEAREAAVDGLACEEASLCGGGVGQDGPVGGDGIEGLHHTAVEEGGEGRVEKDGGGGRGLFEEEAVGEDLRGPSAECKDETAAAESRGEGRGFKLAKAVFSVEGEDGGNGEASSRFDVSVEVEKLPVEAGGQQTANGRLASTHEAGEDEAAKMGERPCSDMRLWGGLGGGLGVHNGSLGVPAYAANESRDL